MESTQVVNALSALAQESRLAIFRLLVQAGPEGIVVGVIAERLAIPLPTLSFHLRTLVHGGLIQSRHEGRFVRYTANFEAMHGLVDYLSENCCGGDPAVCAPQPLSLGKERTR
jgi:DNA-binding transcriptional ArsR family regulator